MGKAHWHKEQALTNQFSALNISGFIFQVKWKRLLIQRIR